MDQKWNQNTPHNDSLRIKVVNKLNQQGLILPSMNQSIIVNISEENKYYYVEVWSKSNVDNKPLGFVMNYKSLAIVDTFTPCMQFLIINKNNK